MKVKINAATVPDDAKPFATIGLLLYTVPSDTKTRAAVPYEVYVGARRFQTLLVHNIIKSLRPYLQKCKVQAVKEEKEEACDGNDL